MQGVHIEAGGMPLAGGISTPGSATSQYLTFNLGSEEYGIEILSVQEIKGYSTVTSIPNTPAYIKGVLNLRGTVIPVVDLRCRFSMETLEYNKFTVVIVVQLGARLVGLIVDGVSDVLDIPTSEIRASPDLGARGDTRFIRGMATIHDKVIVLLSISDLLQENDLPACGHSIN